MSHKSAVLAAAITATALLLSCAKSPEGAATYRDGVYRATFSHFDPQGWKPQLEITVAKGRISKVDFDYTNASAQRKTVDTAYGEAMKAAKGTYPAKYTRELADGLIKKQQAGVDAVTGASTSSRLFNALVAALVDKARTGDSSAVELPMNAAYAAEDKPDERGWIGAITATYAENKVTNVVYDEVKKEGRTVTARKTEDQAYTDRWQKATGDTPKDVYQRLAAALIAKQDPAAVDVITGATGTVQRFKALATAVESKRQ